MMHFVGFRGEEYWAAVKVFGYPDFFHRWNDKRLWTEVAESDIVVFANNAETDMREYSFNDSEVM